MIAAAARRALEALLGANVAFDVPLARHTSLRVGGPADALARPASREDLVRLLALCAEQGLPVHALGAGFNTLVDDRGLAGVVIQLGRLRGLWLETETLLHAEAGVSHSQVARYCSERGLSGLEFAAGIPGSVGGWIAMNAGVPQREMRHVLREALVLLPGGVLQRMENDALGFGYRAARGLPAGALIVSGRFALERTAPEAVAAEIERMLARRAATQPLDRPSCGSVFVNPPGDFAGRLIEAAGLKGRRIGGAEISEVHANFIVNRGGASAQDVLDLIALARSEVERHSGVKLETEVRILGRQRT